MMNSFYNEIPVPRPSRVRNIINTPTRCELSEHFPAESSHGLNRTRGLAGKDTEKYLQQPNLFMFIPLGEQDYSLNFLPFLNYLTRN